MHHAIYEQLFLSITLTQIYLYSLSLNLPTDLTICQIYDHYDYTPFVKKDIGIPLVNFLTFVADTAAI